MLYYASVSRFLFSFFSSWRSSSISSSEGISVFSQGNLSKSSVLCMPAFFKSAKAETVINTAHRVIVQNVRSRLR